MEWRDGPKLRACEAFRGAKCRPSAAKWTFTAEEAEAGWAVYARGAGRAPTRGQWRGPRGAVGVSVV